MLMTDIDFGLAVDPRHARAKAIALAAVEHLVDDIAQHAAKPAFRNLGPILGPVGLDEAGGGVFGVNGKALLAPELDHFGVDVLGGLIDHEPADISIAHHLDARRRGKNRSEEHTSELQSLMRN